MGDQADHEDGDEDEKQDLRDAGRGGRDAAEAEHAGDDGEDEKYQGPVKHDVSPSGFPARELVCVRETAYPWRRPAIRPDQFRRDAACRVWLRDAREERPVARDRKSVV